MSKEMLMWKGHLVKRLLFLLLLLLETAFAQITLSSELTKLLTLAPGETYQGTIPVQNTDKQPATIRVYQADYFYLADGTTEYGEPGKRERSNAPWVTLPAAMATVPAEGELIVNYRVRVPDDPILEGSYWSVIMVEQVADATPEPERPQKKPTVTINTVVRYAVEVVTNIGTTGARKIELANPSLQQNETEQDVLFQVDVTNPGQRYLTPLVHLELYDDSGAQIARFGDQQRRLFPGTSVRQDFKLGTLAPGAYTAVVIADAGGEDVFGTRYTLNVRDGNTPE